MPKPYIPNDKWSRKAQKEGYRARSVYKLMELDEKFRLLKKGMSVLDLGAAPGSWLQYTAKRVGANGSILGIDLQEIEPIEGVETIQTDIATFEPTETYDLILSDLAPKTTGILDIDQWRSIELCQQVIELAKRSLKPKGKLVMKVFRGSDYEDFLQELKENWKHVKTAQVLASRDRSHEIYLVVQ